MNTSESRIAMKMFLCFVVLACAVYMPESAMSEMRENPPAQSTVDINSMVKQVKAAPTDQTTMRQRMEVLTHWAQSMMIKGVSVDSVIPQEKGRLLESLSQNNPSEACKMIDAIYGDVEKFIGDGKYSSPMGNSPQMMPQAEIDKVRKEVKTAQTNSSNVKVRVLALKSWAESLSKKNAYADKIYTIETDLFIKVLQKENPEKAYSLVDKTFADLERAVDPQTDWNAVKAEKHVPQAKKFIPAVLTVNASEVRVSESVPHYVSGAQVTNYPAAFDSGTVRVVNGLVNISVGSVPVIVEPLTNAGAVCTATANSSPFGILEVVERLDRLDTDFYAGKFAKDVGYKWLRFMGPPSAQYMIYKRGGMNLQAGDAYLAHLSSLYESAMGRGVSALVTINPSTGDAKPPMKAGVFTQADVSGYSEFLRALIRKLPKVKHYTMETEVDASWNAADYALALATTKKVFNQECPDCKLYTGGYINPVGTFFEEVFDNLKTLNAKNSFDAFGLWHAFDLFLGVKRGDVDKFELIKTQYKKSRELLNRYGYTNMPVFLGETSYPHDTHNPFTKGYSEANQAANLVKTYTTMIGLGAFRVFWSNIQDYHYYAGGYSIFDYSGLINNPGNDGVSSKKLSYYSYKNLAQKLSCFEAAKTSEVNAGPGVTAHRFEKGGKELYIVWANNAD